MSDNEIELEIAKFESARNKSLDDYFSARPEATRTRELEKMFEAGFHRAWKLLSIDALAEIIAQQLKDKSKPTQ